MKISAGLMLLLLTLAIPGLAQNGRQQFASLGDFKLENGGVIRDCRIGYRTFGRLNRDKSNVVVFPTWFRGTSSQLSGFFGRGRLVDASKYYVVAMDALGDGVSSSPSNSTLQPRMQFPNFTIGDMVKSQHQVLTQVLGITHVKAVVGISMGGMQTFQWMVAFPDFMDMAVPIVGTPRPSPYNMLHLIVENDAITGDPAWNHGDYTEQPAVRLLAEIGALVGSSPDRFNERNTRRSLLSHISRSEKGVRHFDANDHLRQAQAILALDVSAPFGGDMSKAARAVKAKVLVIPSETDHMVTPGPALDFARLIHAQVFELHNNCGHGAPGCEAQKVDAAVSVFLAQ
jgi:homoserine O-acetyltransferase